MKKLISFLTLFTTFLSLIPAMAQQTEPTAQNVTDATKMMNGTWEWEETSFASRGVKPTTRTPASTKKRITITFKPNNTATVFVNSELAGTYTYKLTQQPNDYILISFSDETGNNPAKEFLEEGPLTVSKNELYIAGGYNDAGSNQKFRKLETYKTQKTTRKKKR